MSLDIDLSPGERQDRILALLRDNARLPVADLAARFCTSDDSIRRDLRALAAAGRIRRVHGAVLPAAPQFQSFETREGVRAAEKATIARAAAALVKPGSLVLVDGGTTAVAFARALPADLAIEVATVSPPVALALDRHPAISVILVGGKLDRASRTAVGATTVDAIRAMRPDLAVLGPCSLDPVAGVTATGFEEAAVKRAMVEAAAETVALATVDKLGAASPHLVAPLARVHRIVTGPDVDPALAARFSAAGADLLVAEG